MLKYKLCLYLKGIIILSSHKVVLPSELKKCCMNLNNFYTMAGLLLVNPLS